MKMEIDNTANCINMHNLESFFNYFRFQVKQILLKNKREDIKNAVTNKNNVARCIYFADLPKNVNGVISYRLKDYLENEEIKNVKNIYQYLYNFLFADYDKNIKSLRIADRN